MEYMPQLWTALAGRCDAGVACAVGLLPVLAVSSSCMVEKIGHWIWIVIEVLTAILVLYQFPPHIASTYRKVADWWASLSHRRTVHRLHKLELTEAQRAYRHAGRTNHFLQLGGDYGCHICSGVDAHGVLGVRIYVGGTVQRYDGAVR